MFTVFYSTHSQRWPASSLCVPQLCRAHRQSTGLARNIYGGRSRCVTYMLCCFWGNLKALVIWVRLKIQRSNSGSRAQFVLCFFLSTFFFLGWDQFSGSQALRSHCSALHRHTTLYYITVATRKKIGQINSQNRAFWIWIVMNCVSLP